MLLAPQYIEVHDKIVTVLDPHYVGGFPIKTTIHELKDSNGKVIDHIGFDWSGQIFSVIKKDSIFWFDNSKGYGSVGKKAKEVTGWCYDRDGYTIDGYISSGYYKEHVAS